MTVRTNLRAARRGERPMLATQPADHSPLAASMTTGQALDAVLAAWSAAFHAEFREGLAEAGLGSAIDISLRIDGSGAVVAADGQIDKPVIDAVLTARPELAERYRAIAGDSSILAASRIGRRYSALADDDELTGPARRTLGEDLLVRIDHLETLAGRMTDATTGLISEALAYADAYGAPLC